MLQQLKEKVLQGENISRAEAESLLTSDLEELCRAADEIREKFCGKSFDVCAIINGKSGKCSEDCKYCAQSKHHKTAVAEYGLLGDERIVDEALYNQSKGIHRFSIVTSGRTLSDEEVDSVCHSYSLMKDRCTMDLCASHGLLTYEQFVRLRESGVTRYHNNLETSRRHFPKVCTTHTYDDKIKTIKAAQKAGLAICSGGIVGMGESMADRLDMAFELRALEVKSVPLNVLNPVGGTPFEGVDTLTEDEVLRVTAIYRFILPDSALRLAGGRGLLSGNGRKLLHAGANATISGDMLTTVGTTIEEDMKMIAEEGFEAKKI